MLSEASLQPNPTVLSCDLWMNREAQSLSKDTSRDVAGRGGIRDPECSDRPFYRQVSSALKHRQQTVVRGMFGAEDSKVPSLP